MGEDEDDRREPGHVEPVAPEPSRAPSRAPSASSGARRPAGDRRPARRRGVPGRGPGQFRRRRSEARVEELVKLLIGIHGLTDEVRQITVYLFWRRIVGPQIASKTSPDSISRGVLRVWTTNSVWLHELRFHKARMIEQINTSIAKWPGGPPLVSDIRFALETQHEPADRDDDLRQLRLRHWRRRRPPPNQPPVVSDADEAAIRAETMMVDDDDLRATIERVRIRWNR